MNGPVPLVAFLKSPPARAHFASAIIASPAASRSRNGALGCLSAIRTVCGSTASTDWTTANSRARVAFVLGSSMRSMLNFTSSAVKGLPLWKRTFFRRWRT